MVQSICYNQPHFHSLIYMFYITYGIQCGACCNQTFCRASEEYIFPEVTTRTASTRLLYGCLSLHISFSSVQLNVSLCTIEFSLAQSLRSRRFNVPSIFTQDGQERAEQRGGEEVQGEGEEGEGREGADAEEEGGAQEGERKEEEGDRGYEGAKKEHGKHVQSDGQSEPELWPTPFCEEVLMTLWSQDLEIGMCSSCENKIELFCC